MRIEEIIAVVTDQVTEGQKNDLLAEIKNDPFLHKEYRSLKNAWALSSGQAGMPESKIEKAYLTQKAKISHQKPVITLKLLSVLKYAAILLIAFLWGMLFSRHADDKTGITEIIVPSGQVAEVNLPDGSHVWVNSDTRISFPTGFQDKTRQVMLKGEAYFQVQKAKSQFVVSTKYGDITALGTSFNVHAYDNSRFHATLIDGMVRYSNAKNSRQVILSPGQQVAYSGVDSMNVRKVKTDLFTSWKDGVLIFKKEPLSEVTKRLERHFAVKIELQDSILEDLRFTGNIENESLIDVMEYINMTKPIQYTYNNKQKKLIIRQK